MMKYRNLGATGVKVSPICLGAMMFGDVTDEATAGRIIDRARDHGVNFIDTAEGYAAGASEEIIGRAIAADRNDWVVATKFLQGQRGGPNNRGASRRYIVEATEASLKRLGTDRIDLMYVHKEDPDTPTAETIGALGDLIRQGKILYYGLSNHRAWKVAEFSRQSDLMGVPRPAATQFCYNIANRQSEVEHLSAADYYGVGVVTYSPLARGVLTGKYDPEAAPPPETRAGRNDRRIQQTEWRPESLLLAQRIKAHAEARGVTAGQFAFAWVLNNRFVHSTIAGPRTQAQWDDYLAAMIMTYSADDEALVDEWVTPGHPSTPGYNDPAQPFSGRRLA